MADKCLIRVEKLLKGSSLKGNLKDEILSTIKKVQAEKKIAKLDDINVDAVAKDVKEQIKLQKQINKRNAQENEVKVRNLTEYVYENFKGEEDEGLISILVGSNRQRLGARESVSSQQIASTNSLITGFNMKMKEAKVDELFLNMDKDTQLKVARVMYELNQRQTSVEKLADIKPIVGETDPRIKKLGEVMEEYSEMVRTKLNDRGANIGKLWGYMVRQSHDPFTVRNAADVLNLKNIEPDPNLKNKKDINYNKNYTAWKNFVMEKLDKERTFAGVDDIDEFMDFVYNSIVRNQYVKSDGSAFTYGASVTKDVAREVSSKFKRVLHFKSADDWFAYNDKFGAGNLREAMFSGLQTAGRNIGIMDVLGTKPQQAFNQIRKTVGAKLIKDKRSTEKLKSDDKFQKFFNVVDGSIFSIDNFALAKYSAISRTIASLAKLGGATISAAADIGLYASELRYQGRSFFGGMFEAVSNLAKIKNKKKAKDIAESLGFIADNTIYDIAGRYQVGDVQSKGWTRLQRTFFKLNLLSWWTNTLKEGVMLSQANFLAKQKNISFDKLNPRIKGLFEQYNIDSTKWDVIRKRTIVNSDDGKEFINIADLDKMSDAEVKAVTGIDNLTKRQIKIERDKFKSSVSGILLDRSTFAVIEPDARGKAWLTGGRMAGTGPGEAYRFFFQFKAFPFAIVQKTLSREISFLRQKGFANKARGITGLGSIFLTSALMGYLSMTIKDLIKGKSPRDPTKIKTFNSAIMQGGGLGIYGDVLFQETRQGSEIGGSLLGPVPLTAFDILQSFKYLKDGKGDLAARSAHKAVTQNIPFLNLFYIKTAFDYIIGYQMMETLSPGVLERIENRMERDYGQEFLFTKPSTKFKGF
tara:strand:+ start:1048 stop:3648 length:2601 start_codon:yes stop_codon:yes gene_type:complete